MRASVSPTRHAANAIEASFDATAATAGSIALTSSPNPSTFGRAVSLTATVTTGATGTVTFYDGAIVLGTGRLAGGVASLSTPSLAAGTRRLTAYYSGDSGFPPALRLSTPTPCRPLAEVSLPRRRTRLPYHRTTRPLQWWISTATASPICSGRSLGAPASCRATGTAHSSHPETSLVELESRVSIRWPSGTSTGMENWISPPDNSSR